VEGEEGPINETRCTPRRMASNGSDDTDVTCARCSLGRIRVNAGAEKADGHY
jgi:hypothetical protein